MAAQNVIVLYDQTYPNTQGVATAFNIQGGHQMEYEGQINGQENVPLYTRTVGGQKQLYPGNEADAAVWYMESVHKYADLPAVGQPLYCWWPHADGFAAGFYRVKRVQ